MTILLAGDIGGTKTILRLVNSEYAQNSDVLPHQTTLYEQTYSSQEFTHFVPIVDRFFEEASQKLGQPFSVEKACFGIAGPVVNNTSELTNLSWYLDGDRLQRELSLDKVSLINDFAAIGHGILGLTSNDLFPLQNVPCDPQSPIAVLGAGTGLGECYLIPSNQGKYQVFPSEGSHADFAPRSELEFELLNYIQKTFDLERVSIERVVSGMGIGTIYQFLRDRYPEKESAPLKQIYQTWQQKEDLNIDLSAEISKTALGNGDPLCQQTMQIFIEAYGAEAGNLALKLLPYGGLYVTGGIAPKILPLMQQGNFMKAFLTKGRLSPLLNKIPVYIILNPKVGLIGAALYAAN
ncbi:glucokinase [Rippkaea orientalis PCC 8801]|uniref:Glucokinase n=1 Tax=Rippkaea orientalis (strain PCC 8801 / RF-1) TaxID=41431 RepID=B7K5K6_RIPO1|nr:glucokinase [Rippkaea orientalis]ACK66739.1 glucokinase [Rippkaea orientalis PCC 8801]